MRWIVVVAVGCGSAPPPPPSHSVETREILPELPCSDVIEGPLQIAPTFDPGYLVSAEEIVDREMRRNHGAFLACFVHRLKYDPQLGGTVTLSFRILPDGRPTAIETRGFDAGIDRCVCEKLLGMHFGAASSTTIRYPLRFVPSS
jgi:hypothetical protein